VFLYLWHLFFNTEELQAEKTVGKKKRTKKIEIT